MAGMLASMNNGNTIIQFVKVSQKQHSPVIDIRRIFIP